MSHTKTFSDFSEPRPRRFNFEHNVSVYFGIFFEYFIICNVLSYKKKVFAMLFKKTKTMILSFDLDLGLNWQHIHKYIGKLDRTTAPGGGTFNKLSHFVHWLKPS